MKTGRWYVGRDPLHRFLFGVERYFTFQVFDGGTPEQCERELAGKLELFKDKSYDNEHEAEDALVERATRKGAAR